MTMDLTVTGVAHGPDGGMALATALRLAADTVETAGAVPVRERIRGTVPAVTDGVRVATEYDITVSARG